MKLVYENCNLTVAQVHEDGTCLYLLFAKQANEFIEVLVKLCELFVMILRKLYGFLI